MDIAELDYAIELIDSFLWPDEDSKQRNKRERILRAATDLFERLGYRKTSIDDVARQAGVAKGTVYLYYRNKAELVYHAISFEERQYWVRMRPMAEKNVPPRERLVSFLTVCMHMMREMPLTSSLIQGDHEISIALQEVDKEFAINANALQIEFVAHLLEEATGKKYSKNEIRLQARILVDLFFSLITSNLVNPEQENWDTYVDTLVAMVTDGLVGAEPNKILSTGSASRRGPKKNRRVRVQT